MGASFLKNWVQENGVITLAKPSKYITFGKLRQLGQPEALEEPLTSRHGDELLEGTEKNSLHPLSADPPNNSLLATNRLLVLNNPTASPCLFSAVQYEERVAW